MGSPPGPRRAVRLLRAIGLRVLVWGGLALVALWWLGDVGSLIAPSDWPPPAGVEQGPAGEDDPATAPPEDGWPHLRGPHYNAVSNETDLADSWPAEGPAVLWSGTIGRGYSALTAVGDRVFTQRQTVADQSGSAAKGERTRRRNAPASSHRGPPALTPLQVRWIRPSPCPPKGPPIGESLHPPTARQAVSGGEGIRRWLPSSESRRWR